MLQFAVLAATVISGSMLIAGCAGESRNRGIDPRADQSLRRMSQTLAEAQTLQLESTATAEEPVGGGQWAQISRNSTIRVRRPDRMFAEVRRGSELYRLWFQKGELTILDVQQNVFSRIETPRRIDEMLDFLVDEYGVEVPLSDLLYPNPYEVLTERVITGTYAGQEEIEGRVCDHLLFTQDNVDWQIWIASEREAVPYKVVITYKEEAASPQFEGVMNDWRLSGETDASWSEPQVPSDARRVSAAEVLGQEQGGRR